MAERKQGLTVAQVIARLQELPPEMKLKINDIDYDWGLSMHHHINSISDTGYIWSGGCEEDWTVDLWEEEDDE